MSSTKIIDDVKEQEFKALLNKHIDIFTELSKGPTPKIGIPNELCSDIYLIYSMFKKAGFECYLVGGCIRDSLLGRTPKDWDMATNATTDEIYEIFKNKLPIIPTGIDFGTVTIMCEDRGYEVTTYRGDMYNSEDRNFHYPTSIEFVKTIQEDLSRRDFTINAMAYDINDNILIDPFDGQKDLAEKRIRCVNNPYERFEEDPLRMLRAIRFSAQLGFKIPNDDLIMPALFTSKAKLKQISAERIQVELNKILLSDPLVFLTFPGEMILDVILPEVTRLREIRQNNPWHSYDAYEHTMRATAIVEDKLHLRLATFFHDLGKYNTLSTDEDGVDHFYGHGKESFYIACRIMGRLKYSNSLRDKVKPLIEHHDRRIQPTKKAVKKTLNLLGEEGTKDLLKIRWADITSQNITHLKPRAKKVFLLQDLVKEVIESKEPFTRKDLAINGNNLIRIGFKPGPQLGQALDILLNFVLEDPSVNNSTRLEFMASGLLIHMKQNKGQLPNE